MDDADTGCATALERPDAEADADADADAAAPDAEDAGRARADGDEKEGMPYGAYVDSTIVHSPARDPGRHSSCLAGPNEDEDEDDGKWGWGWGWGWVPVPLPSSMPSEADALAWAASVIPRTLADKLDTLPAPLPRAEPGAYEVPSPAPSPVPPPPPAPLPAVR